MVSYRKVPKVTRTILVTFGFGTLLLSLLLSGSRYFRMAKTSTSHGHFPKKSLKMWKEYFLKKGNVCLYFKSYE